MGPTPSEIAQFRTVADLAEWAGLRADDGEEGESSDTSTRAVF